MTQHTHFSSKNASRSLLIAGLAVLGLSGCGTSPSGPTAPARHVYAGLDTSGSWRPYLGLSATLCAGQVVNLEPGRDKLTLYRMDSTTREFSDGLAPESGDDLQSVIVTEVQAKSTASGTFPARFWQAVAERTDADPIPAVVEAFTDGDNDDLSAQSSKAIQDAVKRLAANPHVESVCIFGAAPRNWATLRAEFAPLGSRFHLCSPPEMTPERVAAALQASP